MASPPPFTLTPGNVTGLQNQQLTFTITVYQVLINGQQQAFTLSDGGSGGTFSPGSVSVTGPVSVVMFTYSNPIVGGYVISAAPNGGPLAGNGPQTANVTITAGNGAGISSGRAGGNMAGAVQNLTGAIFSKGYLFGSNPATGVQNDVPFGVLQDFSLDNAFGLKELMGPEGVVALAAGDSDRKIVVNAKWAKIRPEQYLLAMGGSITTVSAIANPTATPALAATAGTTTYAAGWVGVAFAYRSQYGKTLINPQAAVSLTATQAISVAAITPLPAGVLDADLYATNTQYATSAAAAAGALYLYQAGWAGGATTVTAAPATSAIQNITASNIVSGSRVYQSNILDEMTPFTLQFQTPQIGGIDSDIKVYGLVTTAFKLDYKLKEFVVPDFAANVYGDPTQAGTPLFTIRQL